MPVNGKARAAALPEGRRRERRSVRSRRGPRRATRRRRSRRAPTTSTSRPELAWTPDGKNVCFLLLDRPQTTPRRLPSRRARAARRRSSSPETDAAWINAIEPPHFLKDGSFLFRSERSGFFHLYRHAADGTLAERDHGGKLDDRRARGASTRRRGSSASPRTEKDPRERHVYFARSWTARVSRRADRRAAASTRPSSPGRPRTSSTRSRTSRRRRRPSSATPRAPSPRVRRRRPHALAGYEHPGCVEIGSFTGRGRYALLHAARQAAGFDPAKKYPVDRVRLRRPARAARPERVGAAWPRPLSRLEGIPRLVRGQPRLVGPRARLRDADPEEHGGAGAEGPARGRRRARRSGPTSTAPGSGSRAGPTAGT